VKHTTVNSERRAEVLAAFNTFSVLTHGQAEALCRCPGIRHTLYRMTQDRQLERVQMDTGHLGFQLPQQAAQP
jgi:hypothetical protein